jgi:hypothetical protein
MKTCFRCKESKPYGLFFKHGATSDGYHSWCKNCCTDGNKRSRAKQNLTIEGRAKIFLQNAKKSAAKRQQVFALEIADIVDFWEAQYGVCAYSGRTMTLEAGKLHTVSIERIDSMQGYTIENTVLVCQAINRMKSDFVFDEFYNLCKDVSEFLGDNELKLSVGAHK